MSETETLDQLRNYFRWLETSANLTLSPSPPIPDRPTVIFDQAVEPGHRMDEIASERAFSTPRRFRLMAAAGFMIMLAGGLGILTRISANTIDLGSATSGPLFVLPPENYELSNAHTGSLEGGQADLVAAAVIGRADDDALIDLIAVSVATPASAPTLQELERIQKIDLETGTAYFDVGFPGVMWQERSNGDVITVRAPRPIGGFSESEGVEIADRLGKILEGIWVANDGTIRFDGFEGLSILEQQVDPANATDAEATYFDAQFDGEGSSITVETVAASSVLYSGVPIASDGVERTEVNGKPGIVIRGYDSALAWQATPNRMVALTGEVPIEQLQKLANELRLVDQAEWIEAHGEIVPEHD